MGRHGDPSAAPVSATKPVEGEIGNREQFAQDTNANADSGPQPSPPTSPPEEPSQPPAAGGGSGTSSSHVTANTLTTSTMPVEHRPAPGAQGNDGDAGSTPGATPTTGPGAPAAPVTPTTTPANPAAEQNDKDKTPSRLPSDGDGGTTVVQEEQRVLDEQRDLQASRAGTVAKTGGELSAAAARNDSEALEKLAAEQLAAEQAAAAKRAEELRAKGKDSKEDQRGDDTRPGAPAPDARDPDSPGHGGGPQPGGGSDSGDGGSKPGAQPKNPEEPSRDVPKGDAPKGDIPKGDGPKVDAPRNDGPKNEEGRGDTPPKVPEVPGPKKEAEQPPPGSPPTPAPAREEKTGADLREPVKLKETIDQIGKDVRAVAQAAETTPPPEKPIVQPSQPEPRPSSSPPPANNSTQPIQPAPQVQERVASPAERQPERAPERAAERPVERQPEKPVERPIERTTQPTPQPEVPVQKNPTTAEPAPIKQAPPATVVEQAIPKAPTIERIEKQVEPQIQRVTDRLQQELQAAASVRASNEQSVKAAETIRDIVTKTEQPSIQAVKDAIKVAEIERPLTIAEVVQAKTPQEVRIDKIVTQIQDDLKALAVAVAGGESGGKNLEKVAAVEPAIQKIIDKIEKEITTAVSPSSTGEQASKALETIKEIVAKAGEELTPKQIQEIIKAIDGDRPVQMAKVVTEIDRELQGKNVNPDAQKVIEKIEKLVKNASEVPNEENLRKLEAVKEVLSKGEPITPQVLQEIIKAIEGEKPRLQIELAKHIEETTQPPMSKQEAMQAILGLMVDAQRLSSELVREVKFETENKLGQVQSSIDELLRLRVEQFIALSAYQEGISTAEMTQLLQETLQELATRYALSDEQRQLLSRILVALTNKEFGKDDPNATEPKDLRTVEEKLKAEALAKLKEAPQLREATKEEIARARMEELKELEELLKGREEIRLQKAEKRLKELMKEEIDPNTKYMIDEDLEVIKVFKITGRVLTEKSRLAIKGVNIVGGLLGVRVTDEQGYFEYINVPEKTAYMIGADSLQYTFKPSFFADTLTGTVYMEFIARPIMH